MWVVNFFQKDPFINLEKSISGLGRSDYPFLHPAYNPMNRIPCTDFSFWIRDRLKRKDYKSINRLFLKIIEANPGIAVGNLNSTLSEHWLHRLQEIYSAPLHKIVKYDNEDAYLDLRTLMILDLPHSDKERINYFISCMSPYIPNEMVHKISGSAHSVGKLLSNVPLNSRSHFFDICNLYEIKDHRSFLIEKSSYYSTRQHGIHLKESAERLISEKLIFYDLSPDNAMRQYTKEELEPIRK